jgi:hypothetical protein
VNKPGPDSMAANGPPTRSCVYVRPGSVGLGDLAAVAYTGRLAPGRPLGPDSIDFIGPQVSD